jgi:transcriptional regulator with XRE-family HTH domain
MRARAWPRAHWRNRLPDITEIPVWERLDMRQALAARDIALVYRLLQSHGVSQRRIAAATAQSQSEISEILAGRRRINAYDVLVRIAEGLEVPRGQMGLAYDETTARTFGATRWELRIPFEAPNPRPTEAEILGHDMAAHLMRTYPALDRHASTVVPAPMGDPAPRPLFCDEPAPGGKCSRHIGHPGDHAP